MTDFVTEDNEIKLGDYRFNIRGPVRFQTAGQVAGKVTFGNTSRTDQTIVDEWNQDDWREGHLVNQLDEPTQDGRFWFSTNDTRFRRKMVLPPLVTSIGRPTGITVVAELIWSFGAYVYGCFGGKIHRWNDTSWSAELEDIGATGTDVAIYNATMFVAHSTGYAYSTDGSAWTNSTTDALYFASFYASSSAAFFKIDSTGLVQSSADGITWASNPGVQMTDVTPTGLIVYRNIDDDPTLYVSTTTGLYSVDPYNQIYYKTSLQLLANPNAGKSPVVWTDSLLYVPDTLALWRFPRGGAITNVGLDREDGLPVYVRGNITKLQPHPNWLIAVIDVSALPGSLATEPVLMSAEMAYTSSFSSTETGAYSTIQAYNGSGWHTLYKQTSAGVAIKTIHLATNLSNYQRRLYFSEVDGIKYIVTPEGNYDPVRDGNHRFASTGEHITGWFDANYSEVVKLATSIKFRCEFVTSTETIAVYVRRNNNENDEYLIGTISSSNIATDGTVEFALSESLFDASVTDTEQGFPFYSVQFRFVLSRGSNTYLSPTILFFDLRHKKMFDILWAWTFNISTESFNQGLDTWKTVKTLANQKKMHRFSFRTYEEIQRRVQISNISGVRYTASNQGGTFTVTVVELESGDD